MVHIPETKRRNRCQQRSDFASGNYSKKENYFTQRDNSWVDSGYPHEHNGTSHIPSGRQWSVHKRDYPQSTGDTGEERKMSGGFATMEEAQAASITKSVRTTIPCPEYIWEYNGETYDLNVNCCRKMKSEWDILEPADRLAVFEDLDANKKLLAYVMKISHEGTTLEQFATLVYFLEECDCGFAGGGYRGGNDSRCIDVAIKRIFRRGSANKFVSHRNHKEKYAY